MNIAVYVTSNYSNYDELSKLLTSYIRKYTNSPILLTAHSKSTKPDHGNLLVKRYADENHIRCKVYETEWDKWNRSAGSIASYHMNHNSERSIVFWDGLSRGCRNFLLMTQRLRRPCDLIRVNPNKKGSTIPDEPKNAAQSGQQTADRHSPQNGQQPQNVQQPNAQQNPQNVQQKQQQPSVQKNGNPYEQPQNVQQPNAQQNPQNGQPPQTGNGTVANTTTSSSPQQGALQNQETAQQQQSAITQPQQNGDDVQNELENGIVQNSQTTYANGDEEVIPESEMTLEQLTTSEK